MLYFLYFFSHCIDRRTGRRTDQCHPAYIAMMTGIVSISHCFVTSMLWYACLFRKYDIEWTLHRYLPHVRRILINSVLNCGPLSEIWPQLYNFRGWCLCPRVQFPWINLITWSTRIWFTNCANQQSFHYRHYAFINIDHVTQITR